MGCLENCLENVGLITVKCNLQAEQAHRMALDNCQDFQNIMAAIEERAKVGSFDLTIDNTMPQCLVNALGKMGYEVRKMGDKSQTVVNW